MAGVIDTNVLLFAANESAPEFSRARKFLLSAGHSSDSWYVTEGILYEFLRVSTHPRVFPRPLRWQEAMAFLQPILGSSRFTILRAGERHWRVVEEVLDALNHPAGNLLFDVRTVVLMRENGVRDIHTTDTDFLQFSGIRVLNPLITK
jgi:toxin-antitoxin system PIN domain toxin